MIILTSPKSYIDEAFSVAEAVQLSHGLWGMCQTTHCSLSHSPAVQHKMDPGF